MVKDILLKHGQPQLVAGDVNYTDDEITFVNAMECSGETDLASEAKNSVLIYCSSDVAQLIGLNARAQAALPKMGAFTLGDSPTPFKHAQTFLLIWIGSKGEVVNKAEVKARDVVVKRK